MLIIFKRKWGMLHMGKTSEENRNPTDIISTAFQTMLDNTRDMVFVKDANLVYVAASIPFVKMVGKETVYRRNRMVFRESKEEFIFS